MNEYQPFSLLKPFAHVCLSEKASQQFHLLKMKRTAMEAHLPDAPGPPLSLHYNAAGPLGTTDDLYFAVQLE